jgi:Cft2 family RNA processing exonuclease
MQTLIKEFHKMKHIDLENLDTFEAVAVGAVYVLAVSAGVLIGSSMFTLV